MRSDGHRNSKGRGKKMGRKIVLLIAVIALIAGAAILVPKAARAAVRYVCRIPVFQIRQVRVEGLKYVRRDDFLGFIGNPKGQSVLSYDMKDAMARISGHPWIKSGLVRREFPNSIRFELTERTPAAIAATGAGKYLVDADGYALAKTAQPGWEFLPVIKYPSSPGLRILDPKTAGLIKGALELFKVVRSEGKGRFSCAGVGVCGDGSPCILYKDAVVKVGSEGYAEKVKRLAELESDINRRGIRARMIDLRFPGKVVVREAGSDASGGPASVRPEAGLPAF